MSKINLVAPGNGTAFSVPDSCQFIDIIVEGTWGSTNATLQAQLDGTNWVTYPGLSAAANAVWEVKNWRCDYRVVLINGSSINLNVHFQSR